MIAEYAGTVLLISHDRDFLDRLVSSVIVPDGGGHWIEYAGGYTDMLAQRGMDLTREAPKTGAAKETKLVVEYKPEAPDKKKGRLTFNDKHALETLPKIIADLEAQARELQKRLEDPDFFTRDRKGFEQVMAKLAAVQTKLDEAEGRWL